MNVANTYIDEYFKKAKRGDATAQKQLALLLIRDGNTFIDGMSWLEKAAKSGDADAMYMIGRIKLRKFNDVHTAFQWYEKAAKNGHLNAMIDTGAFYYFGFGVVKSIDKAMEWYQKAAKMNSAVGYHNIGFIYYANWNNYKFASDYFEIAKNLGYADSAYILGVMYLQGLGVKKDIHIALSNLIKSYELGKLYSCRPIGDLYFQGVFDDNVQNPEKAIEWYKTGAQFGEMSCIEVLGDIYFHGIGVETDYLKAHNFYKISADYGSSDAAYMIGSMYVSGKGVAKDLRQALVWMNIAHSRGNTKAQKFIVMLNDILGGAGTASVSNLSGGASGVSLRRSHSESAEIAWAEERKQEEIKKKKNRSIYAAAGALSGNGSFVDYEMGAVIDPDGNISYVDTDLGIIMGADGSVSSHDSATGFTYNWSNGNMLMYDETFGATMDISSGKVSFDLGGVTFQ